MDSFIKGVSFWYGGIIFFNCKLLLCKELPKMFFKAYFEYFKWISFLQYNKVLFLKPKISYLKKNNKSICKKKLSNIKCFNDHWRFLLLFNTIMSFSCGKIDMYLDNNFFSLQNNFFLYCKIKRRKLFFNYMSTIFINKNTQTLNFRRLLPKLNFFSKYLRESFLKKRIDFRKLETISIDPAGTLEIDDLIHYRFLEIGTLHEVGLHIPDVHSVLLNCPELIINIKEKFKSNFFFNENPKMFPLFLSKNFYSFSQNIDRLSFSSTFLFDNCGRVKKIKLARSLIKNKRCFSEIKLSKNYKKFRNSNDQSTRKNCFFIKKLILLKSLCFKLKSLRLKLKGNSRFLTNFGLSTNLNRLKYFGDINEELVILSNVTIAEKILEFFPNCSDLRKLGSLKVTDFSRIFQISVSFSIKLNFSTFKKSIKDLQILTKIKNEYQTLVFVTIFYETLISDGIIFFDFKNKYNFNLNKINWGPVYLQTSSPVRRFSDTEVQKIFSKIKFQKKYSN